MTFLPVDGLTSYENLIRINTALAFFCSLKTPGLFSPSFFSSDASLIPSPRPFHPRPRSSPEGRDGGPAPAFPCAAAIVPLRSRYFSLPQPFPLAAAGAEAARPTPPFARSQLCPAGGAPGPTPRHRPAALPIGGRGGYKGRAQAAPGSLPPPF